MNRTIQSIKEIIQQDIMINTDILWKCAHRYLWNNYSFSEKEISRAKNLIKEYFEEILPEIYLKTSGEKIFEFSMRILLASDYVKRKSGRYIPHPVIWFNPNNPHGFIGTKNWFTAYMETTNYENIRFYNENGKLIIKKDSNGFKNLSN